MSEHYTRRRTKWPEKTPSVGARMPVEGPFDGFHKNQIGGDSPDERKIPGELYPRCSARCAFHLATKP